MVAQVQILEPWNPEAEAADTPGMSVVGPLHGPKNRLTPSAALCPLAAWALQGYSGPSQVKTLASVLLIYTSERTPSRFLPWCLGSLLRIVVDLRTDHSSTLEQARPLRPGWVQPNGVVRHCDQCVQEVELNQLATWIRETARSGGLVSSPFCLVQQDAAARDWQSPAVEKRCTSPASPAVPAGSIALRGGLMMV